MIFQTEEWGGGGHGLLFLIPPTLAHPPLLTRITGGWGTWVGAWMRPDGQPPPPEGGWMMCLEHRAVVGRVAPLVPEYQQVEETGSRWRTGDRDIQPAVVGTGEGSCKGTFLCSPKYHLSPLATQNTPQISHL